MVFSQNSLKGYATTFETSNGSKSTSRGRALTNAFGIYVHIPFCVHKCSYCDFYSFTRYDDKDFPLYASAVTHELESAGRWLLTKDFRTSAQSVFFGGGTPSLLPIPLWTKIWQTLSSQFSIQPEAEITLEANPETVSEAFVSSLKGTRINRISLGAQSFSAENLAKLERLGSAQSIRTAVHRLKEQGFGEFSLDLIFGIPGQTKEDVLTDIAKATELGPKHISFYSLTLKPAHPLFHHLPCDDEAADLYEVGVEALEAAGYLRYEISNFALPGHESRHNLLYWNGGDFLGIGPSAASRFFWEGRFHHRKQVADYASYLKQSGFEQPGFDSVTASQTILEATFLELRKRDGVNPSRFQERYGYDLAKAKKFELFRQEGFLVLEDDHIRLTPKGYLIADTITRDLVD